MDFGRIKIDGAQTAYYQKYQTCSSEQTFHWIRASVLQIPCTINTIRLDPLFFRSFYSFVAVFILHMMTAKVGRGNGPRIEFIVHQLIYIHWVPICFKCSTSTAGFLMQGESFRDISLTLMEESQFEMGFRELWWTGPVWRYSSTCWKYRKGQLMHSY